MNISDEGIYRYAEVSLLSHHPFHCWTVLVFPSDLPKNEVGGRACGAGRSSPSITRFTVGELFVRRGNNTFSPE